MIALSSAEAELYALLKGTAQSLGLKSMAAAFGDELHVAVWSDATAAIAIAQRGGLGKLRHIQTQYLWIQERVAAKDIGLKNVLGTDNPADLLTKHLPREVMERHLEFSGLVVKGGRAEAGLKTGT